MVEIGRVKAKAGNAPSEQKNSAYPQGRFPIVLWTAARSMLNMTATAVTSGSVLLCLFAAKRLPYDYLLLIFAVAAVLAVFAFAAEGSS
jgi:hypothetical protein